MNMGNILGIYWLNEDIGMSTDRGRYMVYGSYVIRMMVIHLMLVDRRCSGHQLSIVIRML